MVDKSLCRLVLLAVGLFGPAALAADAAIHARICVFEGSAVPVFDPPVQVPVGCERVDCCPGCPGPGVFEWRIRVDAKALETVELRFEGLDAAERRRLKISGHARLVGNRIVLTHGESRISGIPASAGRRGRTVASLVPVLSKDAARIVRSGQSASKKGDKRSISRSVRDSIAIDQFVGSSKINSFNWIGTTVRCRPPGLQEDTLKVEGLGAGQSVVVLMDARTSVSPGGCTNDRVFASGAQSGLGNLLASAGCASEIAIFSENHAMHVASVKSWTNQAGDRHTVKLGEPVLVPVSVWVPDDATAAVAEKHMEKTKELYRNNRVGVRFEATIKKLPDVAPDAIAVVSAGVSTNGGTKCQSLDAIKSRDFYTPKTLNVYYVDKAFTGRNCAILDTPFGCTSDAVANPPGDGNINFIGRDASSTTLAHEFGHAFGLRPADCGAHTQDLAEFGPENIMAAAGGDERVSFTLGQVFRMNTHMDDWGGTMLILNGLRPGPSRPCRPDIASNSCPALSKNWP